MRFASQYAFTVSLMKNGVIVGVDTRQRERQGGLQLLKDRDQQVLLTYQQRCAFRPATRDICQNQGLNITAARRWAAVYDQVRFYKTRRRIAPVGERPHRYLAAYARRACRASPPHP